MNKIILYTCGIINFILAIFHMFFWKLLNWSEELPRLSNVNQGILQIANIILIFIILYFAIMSFIMARHEKIEMYSKSIIICICGFYSIRLITGYIFFNFSLEELFISTICILIIAGYLSILIIDKHKAS
jgi:hypothetical protein